MRLRRRRRRLLRCQMRLLEGLGGYSSIRRLSYLQLWLLLRPLLLILLSLQLSRWLSSNLMLLRGHSHRHSSRLNLLLLVLQSLRLHSNVHGQLLQTLLQCGYIIVGIE